uniref:Uncharacterized protein n=1 Tax=Eutreptiella gymnastica TaxID=73025 RepID=A0A7S1JG84_9EUGL|mmetsp:Transcript_93015/g.161211  ORF Transcript_93015/g.161211 Transcript_93015/m.161211 type:complete len:816 (+) Transcript_93015:181-2628(+)
MSVMPDPTPAGTDTAAPAALTGGGTPSPVPKKKVKKQERPTKTAARSLHAAASRAPDANQPYQSFRVNTKPTELSVVAPQLASIRPVAMTEHTTWHALKPVDATVLDGTIHIPHTGRPQAPPTGSAPVYMAALHKYHRSMHRRSQTPEPLARLNRAPHLTMTAPSRSTTPDVVPQDTTPYDYTQYPKSAGTEPPFSLVGMSLSSFLEPVTASPSPLTKHLHEHRPPGPLTDHLEQAHWHPEHEFVPASGYVFPTDNRIHHFAATGTISPDLGMSWGACQLPPAASSLDGLNAYQDLAGRSPSSTRSTLRKARPLQTPPRKRPVQWPKPAKPQYDSLTNTFCSGAQDLYTGLAELPEVVGDTEYIMYVNDVGGYNPTNAPSVTATGSCGPRVQPNRGLQRQTAAELRRKKAIVLWNKVDQRLNDTRLSTESKTPQPYKRPESRQRLDWEQAEEATWWARLQPTEQEGWQLSRATQAWLEDRQTAKGFQGHKEQRRQDLQRFAERFAEIEQKREELMQKRRRSKPGRPSHGVTPLDPVEDANELGSWSGDPLKLAARPPPWAAEGEADAGPGVDAGTHTAPSSPPPPARAVEAQSPTRTGTQPMRLTTITLTALEAAAAPTHLGRQGLPSPFRSTPVPVHPRLSSSLRGHTPAGTAPYKGNPEDDFKPFDYNALRGASREQLPTHTQAGLSFDEDVQHFERGVARLTAMKALLEVPDAGPTSQDPVWTHADGPAPSLGGRLPLKDQFYHKPVYDSYASHSQSLQSVLRPAELPQGAQPTDSKAVLEAARVHLIDELLSAQVSGGPIPRSSSPEEGAG